MNLLKAQLNLFFIALAFLTRLPVPQGVDYDQLKLNQASRYFSLVGWVIGLACGCIFLFASIFFSAEIAVLLSMLVSVFLTGCFHEDGLADTCDGFGGGWSTEQKLSIMKDSRLGTYGATALWFAFTLKFVLLISQEDIFIALVVSHPLSRSVSSVMMHALNYVTDNQTSKVKPLAKPDKLSDLWINLVIGGCAILLVLPSVFPLLFGLVVGFMFLKYLFKAQIGGFTGDTLGATQQVSELVIYSSLIVGVSL